MEVRLFFKMVCLIRYFNNYIFKVLFIYVDLFSCINIFLYCLSNYFEVVKVMNINWCIEEEWIYIVLMMVLLFYLFKLIFVIIFYFLDVLVCVLYLIFDG